jgi:pimeloyl-ACP methyl ester carboxylesterase
MRFILSTFFILLMVIGYFPISILWRETKIIDNRIQLAGKFINTSDGLIYYQQVGFPEQPVIVYLGGYGEWSENWKPTMSFLAQHGYRGVALDLPPWGLSPAPPSNNYSRTAQAARIKRAIDNLRIKDFILVSHAEGARTALTLAEMDNRIRGLVFVNPDVGLPAVKGQSIQKFPPWVESSMKNPIAREFAAAIVTHSFFTRPLLKKSLYNPKSLSAFALKVYRYPFDFKGTNRKIADWLLEYIYGRDLTLSTDVKFYEKFRSPTLIVWGERDAVTPAWQAETFKGLMPQAEIKMINNVGHTPQLEAPSVLNESLLKFIGKIQKPVKL